VHVGAIRAETPQPITIAPGQTALMATMATTHARQAPATSPPGPRTPTASPNLVTVFAGLMLGMFLGAVNRTIIAPAMPRIIAELGGMRQLQLDRRFTLAGVNGHCTDRR
jgi:ribose/xylose/arabinose/galactoside ABC-type transport system permease subunit